MDEYKQIVAIADSEPVKTGLSFSDLINTHLQMGSSRWAVRYGVLGDGHEKITDSQKYFQSIKEMYVISCNIELQKASALEQKANLLEAEEALIAARKESEKLRAQASVIRAKSLLASALVTIKDQMRQVDELNKIRLELKDEVEAQYPLGIEQAEPDNWKARFEYRMLRAQAGCSERVDNIPLPQEMKAELGYAYGRFDAIASCAVNKPDVQKALESTYKEKAVKQITAKK